MRRMYDKEEIKEIAAESGGSKVDSLDLVVGTPTVTYDTTDGITIESTGKLNGTDDIVVSNEIPIIAGKGVVIDKLADKEQIEVKVDINDAVKYSTFTDSIVIGDGRSTRGKNSIGIGYSSKYASFTGSNSISIGYNLKSELYHGINIGFENTATSNSGGSTGKATIGSGLYNDYDYCFVLGTYNVVAKKEDRFVLGDGKNDSNRHNYFEITKDTSNVYHMFLNGTEVPTQTKTLFGNQSIVGSGNIDLYCHNISFDDKVYFTAYSSNNLEVDSLTDLQTVFPDDIWKSASGTSPDQTKTVIAINCRQMKVRYSDATESSLAEYSAPIDTVTTV